MTDEKTVLLARGGDKAAEDLILKKYLPLVKAVSARFFLCGGEAEDLEQEGLCGLFSAINGFHGGGANFSTYAYTCIRNSVIDAVKKSRGAKHSALNNFVPILEICGEASYENPEAEVIKSENRREFLQKISGILSSLEFQIIVMYIDGSAVGEISAALGKSQKSVSNALARAKNKLIKLYSEK